MAVEVLVEQRDREKYGMPQPLLFDLTALDNLSWSVSGAWEDELVDATDQGISELMGGLLKGRGRSKIALVWLALKMAAADPTDVPNFADLDIAWRLVKTRDMARPKRKAADADPPASGSSEPSPE